MRPGTTLLGAVSAIAAALFAADPGAVQDDGYRGIWYFNQPSHDEYVYKYSGGFATYPQQHLAEVWEPGARRCSALTAPPTGEHC
jgi:hypothetical protein